MLGLEPDDTGAGSLTSEELKPSSHRRRTEFVEEEVAFFTLSGHGGPERLTLEEN